MPALILGSLCPNCSAWRPVLPATSRSLPSSVCLRPILRKPPSACSTASGKPSVSEASFPCCGMATIGPWASKGFYEIEMRRLSWTPVPMPYVSNATSKPRALPWPVRGWVRQEPDSDSCLRASLERPMGTRTSQPIGEGKGRQEECGPAQGAQMWGSKFRSGLEPLNNT